MDTQPNPIPPDLEPVPARAGRETPSRRRQLATGVAVLGLATTGVLAVILSAAATSGAADPTSAGGTAREQAPAAQPSVVPNGAVPAAPFGGQPPQFGQGAGPGHAATGGS